MVGRPGPPAAGSVIRYRYLWTRDGRAGQRVGSKQRPAVIVIATSTAGETIVVPITHTEPLDAATAVEVPPEERRRVGLDDERSWVIVAEVNAFVWPDSDLHPVPDSELETFVYGRLSKQFFTRVLFQIQSLIRAGRIERAGR